MNNRLESIGILLEGNLQLSAEFESLKKDAERYRWLKDRSTMFERQLLEFASASTMDNVIDAVIKQEKKK